MSDENHDSTPASQEPRLSEEELRRRRRLLIVAGVILVPIAAFFCGFCCCFGGVILGEAVGWTDWLRPNFAIAWVLFCFSVGAITGGGLLIYYLCQLWKKRLNNSRPTSPPQD